MSCISPSACRASATTSAGGRFFRCLGFSDVFLFGFQRFADLLFAFLVVNAKTDRMKILYLRDRPENTEFYPTLRKAVGAWRPVDGSPSRLSCDLKQTGGYSGDFFVEVIPGVKFESNWQGRDETRFPARIRAAATALRDTAHLGKFRVSHRDGMITITTILMALPKEPTNPPWNREELLLALELYMRNRKSPPSKSSREVEAVSMELNRLRACIGGRGAKSLRNPAGVYLKMMNFRSFDPEYTAQGKLGMRHGNKLDRVVWNEFSGKKEELFKACRAIREAINELPENSDDEVEDDGFAEAAEGRLLTKLHRRRERSVRLVTAKKRWAMTKFSALTCEASGFDFAKAYGARGQGFIECHHTKPVHEFGDGHKTTTKDLRLVCANCHRIIHAKRPWITVDEVKALLNDPPALLLDG